jgi:hypothetical protein
MGHAFCFFQRVQKSESFAEDIEVKGRDERALEGVFGYPTPGQSRWLSKERGCGKGKTDRCQNKGDMNFGQ